MPSAIMNSEDRPFAYIHNYLPTFQKLLIAPESDAERQQLFAQFLAVLDVLANSNRSLTPVVCMQSERLFSAVRSKIPIYLVQFFDLMVQSILKKVNNTNTIEAPSIRDIPRNSPQSAITQPEMFVAPKTPFTVSGIHNFRAPAPRQSPAPSTANILTCPVIPSDDDEDQPNAISGMSMCTDAANLLPTNKESATAANIAVGEIAKSPGEMGDTQNYDNEDKDSSVSSDSSNEDENDQNNNTNVNDDLKDLVNYLMNFQLMEILTPESQKVMQAVFVLLNKKLMSSRLALLILGKYLVENNVSDYDDNNVNKVNDDDEIRGFMEDDELLLKMERMTKVLFAQIAKERRTKAMSRVECPANSNKSDNDSIPLNSIDNENRNEQATPMEVEVTPPENQNKIAKVKSKNIADVKQEKWRHIHSKNKCKNLILNRYKKIKLNQNKFQKRMEPVDKDLRSRLNKGDDKLIDYLKAMMDKPESSASENQDLNKSSVDMEIDDIASPENTDVLRARESEVLMPPNCPQFISRVAGYFITIMEMDTKIDNQPVYHIRIPRNFIVLYAENKNDSQYFVVVLRPEENNERLITGHQFDLKDIGGRKIDLSVYQGKHDLKMQIFRKGHVVPFDMFGNWRLASEDIDESLYIMLFLRNPNYNNNHSMGKYRLIFRQFNSNTINDMNNVVGPNVTEYKMIRAIIPDDDDDDDGHPSPAKCARLNSVNDKVFNDESLIQLLSNHDTFFTDSDDQSNNITETDKESYPDVSVNAEDATTAFDRHQKNNNAGVNTKAVATASSHNKTTTNFVGIKDYSCNSNDTNTSDKSKEDAAVREDTLESVTNDIPGVADSDSRAPAQEINDCTSDKEDKATGPTEIGCNEDIDACTSAANIEDDVLYAKDSREVTAVESIANDKKSGDKEKDPVTVVLPELIEDRSTDKAAKAEPRNFSNNDLKSVVETVTKDQIRDNDTGNKIIKAVKSKTPIDLNEHKNNSDFFNIHDADKVVNAECQDFAAEHCPHIVAAEETVAYDMECNDEDSNNVISGAIVHANYGIHSDLKEINDIYDFNHDDDNEYYDKNAANASENIANPTIDDSKDVGEAKGPVNLQENDMSDFSDFNEEDFHDDKVDDKLVETANEIENIEKQKQQPDFKDTKDTDKTVDAQQNEEISDDELISDFNDDNGDNDNGKKKTDEAASVNVNSEDIAETVTDDQKNNGDNDLTSSAFEHSDKNVTVNFNDNNDLTITVKCADLGDEVATESIHLKDAKVKSNGQENEDDKTTTGTFNHSDNKKMANSNENKKDIVDSSAENSKDIAGRTIAIMDLKNGDDNDPNTNAQTHSSEEVMSEFNDEQIDNKRPENSDVKKDIAESTDFKDDAQENEEISVGEPFSDYNEKEFNDDFEDIDNCKEKADEIVSVIDNSENISEKVDDHQVQDDVNDSITDAPEHPDDEVMDLSNLHENNNVNDSIISDKYADENVANENEQTTQLDTNDQKDAKVEVHGQENKVDNDSITKDVEGTAAQEDITDPDTDDPKLIVIAKVEVKNQEKISSNYLDDEEMEDLIQSDDSSDFKKAITIDECAKETDVDAEISIPILNGNEEQQLVPTAIEPPEEKMDEFVEELHDVIYQSLNDEKIKENKEDEILFNEDVEESSDDEDTELDAMSIESISDLDEDNNEFGIDFNSLANVESLNEDDGLTAISVDNKVYYFDDFGDDDNVEINCKNIFEINGNFATNQANQTNNESDSEESMEFDTISINYDSEEEEPDEWDVIEWNGENTDMAVDPDNPNETEESNNDETDALNLLEMEDDESVCEEITIMHGTKDNDIPEILVYTKKKLGARPVSPSTLFIEIQKVNDYYKINVIDRKETIQNTNKLKEIPIKETPKKEEDPNTFSLKKLTEVDLIKKTTTSTLEQIKAKLTRLPEIRFEIKSAKDNSKLEANDVPPFT